VRDDRVQILSTSGEQVATIQDSNVGGWVPSLRGDDDLVVITSADATTNGTFVYDLGTGHLLRISHGYPRWNIGGPTPAGEFMWSTSVNHDRGTTQHLARFLSRG
jgi:hypothetical protein